MPPFVEEGAYCLAHVGRFDGQPVGPYVGIP